MTKIIDDYVNKTDWRVVENANTGYSFSGLKSYIASSCLAKDSLSKLPSKIRDAHKTGKIHIHDLDGGIGIPYSYLKDTCILINIDGEILYMPMESLFNKFKKYVIKTDNMEVIDFRNIINEYYTNKLPMESKCNNIKIGYKKINIKIFDGKNGFINLYKIIRHITDKNLLQINTSDGKIMCVTEDHPIVLSDNLIKNANELKIDDWLQIDDTLENIEETIYIDEKISYIIGYAIGDGFVSSHGNLLYITGNDLNYVVKLLDELNINNHIMERKNINKLSQNKNYVVYINGRQFARFYKDTCGIRYYAENKNLPITIFQWNKFSIGALISGLIDSDGYVTPNKLNFICMSAYSVITGLQELLKLLGIKSRIRFHTNSNNIHSIISNYDMWVITFRIPNDKKDYFTLSQKAQISENSKYDNFKNSKNTVHRIKKIFRKVDYVYDVTTETSTFVSGGLKLHNCYGADLQQLMLEGLKNPIGSNSNPAKHFDTFIDHVVNFVYISQSEFNGAQAMSNFDTLASAFVMGKDYNYVKQNIQRLIYNVSYPLRSSFQSPFLNLSFDVLVPHHMENEPVIIGGRTSEDYVYGNLQTEMDMINKAFLELMIGGDSQGKPFTFPIPSYGVTKELLEKDDEVTNLLWRLSAKFGNPNFMNYISTGNNPSDVRAMCCRLSLSIKDMKARGLWNMGNRTGSLGVCLSGDETVRKIGAKNWEECRIYKIKVGDKLQTFVNGNIEETTVVAVNKRNVNRKMKIYFSRPGTKEEWHIEGTFEHPVLLTNGEWKTFFELSIGDKLIFIRQTGFPQIDFSNKLVDRKRKAEITNSQSGFAEKRIMKLIEQENLPIIRNKELSFPGAIPDFIVTNTKKLIEVDNTKYRHDISLIKKKIYEENGYECLVLKLNLSDTDNEILIKLKMYLYNGATVLRKEIIEGKIDGANQFGSKFEIDKHYTVYNLECSPHHSYISKGLVSHNCTINLNQASINGSDHFIENIDEIYDLAVEELMIKNKYIHESFNKGLLPFTKCYLPNKDPFKTFFHTIGIHGMNEACLNMFDSTIEFNQDFTIEMLKHLRKRVEETSEETNILTNMEESPMEGGTYRLAKLDRKLGLPVQGEDNPYLTNSTHCPVNTPFDWAATIGVQEKFKKWYSGGTIFHGFVGDPISPETAKSVITHMSTDTTIPYYNITPTYSICQNHGYSSGNVPICLKCNRPNFVYSRVVGYIQPVQKWNPGKVSEFKDRKMYKLKLSEEIPHHIDIKGEVVVE